MKAIRKFLLVLFIFCFLVVQAYAQVQLSWQDCIIEAKKNNPDLISAEEFTKEQKANKTITASSLFPQVDASLGASTGGSSDQSQDSYSYGVSGSQLVFDGMKTMNNINAAKENVKAAQQNYRFASSNVRLALRTAFVNLLKAQELIKVAEEIVKIRKENFELITLRYHSGLEHKGALMTAEANLSQASFELAQAKRNIELAQRQLTKEMGRNDFMPMKVMGEFIVSDQAKEKPDFTSIVGNNPQVLEALARKNSATFGIKSAYGNFAPQVSGSASAGKNSGHWPPEDNQWNLGVNVSMPIFEGGLRTAEVARARASYNQAEADQRSIRDQAIVGLEQTWASLQDAVELVDVGLKNLKATEERAKIAEAQYSTGFISFDNWIIIQDDLVRAKNTYLAARANALYTEADWIQAKGETLEYAQ